MNEEEEMGQTKTQAGRPPDPAPGHRLSEELTCVESRAMASKFVAQQNLAAANEVWTDSMRASHPETKRDEPS